MRSKCTIYHVESVLTPITGKEKYFKKCKSSLSPSNVFVLENHDLENQSKRENRSAFK